MKGIRPIFGVLLVALIALTSVSMSLARGKMRDQSGAIVLCTGTGPISVRVDSQGQPIGPMPICPDCAFSFFDHFVDTTPLFHFVPVQFDVVYATEIPLSQGRVPVVARARGPPWA